MPSPILAFVFALLLFPVAGMAQTDCFGSMKDMLDGTLEVADGVADETVEQPDEAGRSDNCTLAGGQGEDMHEKPHLG